MEKRLVYFEILPANSFYQYRRRYEKIRKNIYDHIAEFDEKIAHFQHTIEELQETIKQMQETIDTKNSTIREKNETIEVLTNETVYYASSKSWKITRPMRQATKLLRTMKG
jgi:regulator of replication initiation timing